MEEVRTSLPDVQSIEIQILEDENDANVQHNKISTSQLAAYMRKMQESIFLAVNVTLQMPVLTAIPTLLFC